MSVILKVTIDRFLAQNVVPGSTIYTDGLKTFTAPDKHVSRPQPQDLRKGAKSVVPWRIVPLATCSNGYTTARSFRR